MLTKNITSTRPVPNEPGQTMTFRQLGWRQLLEAEEARSATVLRGLRAMGGELFRDIQSFNRPTVEQDATKQQAADPLTKFDQATVLRAGIAAWTYPEKLSAENIDLLDPETAKWAALEILNMGAPPLEQEAEDRFFDSHPSSTATVALGAAATLQANGSSV